MRRKIPAARISIAAAAAFIMIMMLLFPKETMSAASEAVSAWLSIILPSLLPFSIVSLMLIHTGTAARLFSGLGALSRIVFGFSGSFLYILACSFASGYPMGARLTGELARSDGIDPSEEGFIANAASTTGPLFLAGSAASGMLGDISAAAPLIISHYAGALLTAFINGRIYNRFFFHADAVSKSNAAKCRVGEALSLSVNVSVSGMLSILGFMTLFFVVSRSLKCAGFFELFPEDYAGYALAGVSGALEMTSGCIFASELPRSSALCMISFFTGFGGLSIILQSMTITATDRCFFLSKLFQGSLSSLICALIVGAQPVFFIVPVGVISFSALIAVMCIKKQIKRQGQTLPA